MKLSDLTKKRIRLAYSVLLSLLIALVGVLLSVSCYSISRSGDHPFTPESVSRAFHSIRIPVFLTLAVIIGGAVLDLVLPEGEGRLKPAKMSRATLDRLTATVKWDMLTEEAKAEIEKERRLRRVMKTVMTVLAVLSATLPFIYFLNPDNFPAEQGEFNSEILHGMLLYLIFLCPIFIYSIVYGFVTERSVASETALVKEAIKLYGRGENAESGESSECAVKTYLKKNEGPIRLGVRIALLGAAVVFITVGAIGGGAESVLAKAVKICTECIGLG